MRWSAFDENERARLERNEALRNDVLGPEIYLDDPQAGVWKLYEDLRRQTPSEQGVAIPESLDPVVKGHLRALDVAFLEERSKRLDAERKARQQQPPRR